MNQNFNDLPLVAALQESVQKLGWEKMTAVQAAAIPLALEGRDVLATAQTGTGKTGAFGVPLIAALGARLHHRAVVLAPTRELAAQIYKVLRQLGSKLGCRGSLVVGGESFSRQVRENERGVDFIVATPGRLNDHLREGTIDLRDVSILVLDEVDRMLDMGFLGQIKEIVREIPSERQTLLFSATLPKEVVSLSQSFLRNPARVEIGAVSQPAAQVKEESIHTTNEGKVGVILKELEKRDGQIIVFARTQSRTDRLARVLMREGHKAVYLHGGCSQSQRKRALEKFRSGAGRIMVATDLVARGIDVDNVEHVINYDLPSSREDYIHRIGRTGRCGKSGNALNLIANTDLDVELVLSGRRPKPRQVYSSSRDRRFSRGSRR